MKVTIEGSEKEIADLVLALQDRPEAPSEEMLELLKKREEWLEKNNYLRGPFGPPPER